MGPPNDGREGRAFVVTASMAVLMNSRVWVSDADEAAETGAASGAERGERGD